MRTGTLLLALLAGAISASAQPAEPPPGDVMVRKSVMMYRADAAAGPGAADVRYFNVEMIADSKVVKGAPYSAEAVTETTQVLQDGNRIHRTMSATLYRDSLGRTRREQTLKGLGPLASTAQEFQTIFISDPVAGVSYTLDPQTHIARKMLPPPGPGMPGEFGVVAGPGPESGAAGVFTAKVQPPASKTEPLGKRNIEGVEADGTRTTMTIPAGQVGNERPIEIVSERWYSAQLQTLVLSTRKDPMMGDTTYRLININRSEPPASLFLVPPEYTVKEGGVVGGVRVQRFAPGGVGGGVGVVVGPGVGGGVVGGVVGGVKEPR